jgi:hypothetical protein
LCFDVDSAGAQAKEKIALAMSYILDTEGDALGNPISGTSPADDADARDGMVTFATLLSRNPVFMCLTGVNRRNT